MNVHVTYVCSQVCPSPRAEGYQTIHNCLSKYTNLSNNIYITNFRVYNTIILNVDIHRMCLFTPQYFDVYEPRASGAFAARHLSSTERILHPRRPEVAACHPQGHARSSQLLPECVHRVPEC